MLDFTGVSGTIEIINLQNLYFSFAPQNANLSFTKAVFKGQVKKSSHTES